MSLENIDPNRGLVQKPLPDGGPLISMCKTVPGVYFDANGVLCSDELAALAGFDVKGDKQLKAKNEAHEKARQKIEEQFAKDTAALDAGGGGSPDAGAAGEGDGDGGDGGDSADDGTPFVDRTSGGEPRVARTVQGGPVKEMEYHSSSNTWAVKNRDTGEILDEGLKKEDAGELLLTE